MPQSQGQDALIGAGKAQSLSALPAPVQAVLSAHGAVLAKGFRDAFQVEFTIENGRVWLLDAQPAKRSSVAALRINVDLAEAGIIGRNDAILRTEPHTLGDHLHPQIAENSPRDILATGLSASPGAATGQAEMQGASQPSQGGGMYAKEPRRNSRRELEIPTFLRRQMD